MGMLVAAGALVICPFGTIPAELKVTSQGSILAEGKPVATVQDFAPNINISSCGLCSSMGNPQVAAATAAALGTLTPQPCIPAVAQPWTTARTKYAANGKPCLTNEATAVCSYGGNLSIKDAGQKTIIT